VGFHGDEAPALAEVRIAAARKAQRLFAGAALLT
jgi:hypothetical protein